MNVTAVDCRCQTATAICVWIEQSAGRQTLTGFIRKPCHRSSMDHVSMIQFPVAYLIVLIIESEASEKQI